MRKILLISLIFICCTSSTSLAATYYMQAKGSAANKAQATDGCSDPAKTMSLSIHNGETFAPGDIIIVCGNGGDFTATDFVPPSSGTSESYITYKAEGGSTPIFSGRKHGVVLTGRNYLKFVGLTFQNTSNRWVEIDSSDYIWFDQCTFYDSGAYAGIWIKNSTYGKITNCVFPDADQRSSTGDVYWDAECTAAYNAGTAYPSDCDGQTAPADMIQTYLGDGPGKDSQYWIIEGNLFGYCSHEPIDIQASMNNIVIRNNTTKNVFHTGIERNDRYNTTSSRSYQLIENNIVWGSGFKKNNDPSKAGRTTKNAAGFYIGGNYSIMRNNVSVSNDYGLLFSVQPHPLYTNNSKFYNNTFYNNWQQVYHTMNNFADMTDNIFVNNMVFDDSSIPVRPINDAVTTYKIWYNHAESPYSGSNYFANNSFTPGADSFFFKNTISSNKTLVQLKSTYPTEWASSNFDSTPSFNKHITGTTISFVNSNPDTITDSGSGFITAGFESGDQIVVMGSPCPGASIACGSNDNIYTIDSVTAGTIILVAEDSLTKEDAGNNISITERHFLLKDASKLNNAGAWLTYASEGASSASFIKVEDAGYFYDGWNIPGEMGDFIQTEKGGITYIKNIDYDTNTIEVYPAIDIDKGEGVALLYQSSSDFKLGDKPDVGVRRFIGDFGPR